MRACPGAVVGDNVWQDLPTANETADNKKKELVRSAEKKRSKAGAIQHKLLVGSGAWEPLVSMP